jgi:hypothetical protein
MRVKRWFFKHMRVEVWKFPDGYAYIVADTRRRKGAFGTQLPRVKGRSRAFAHFHQAAAEGRRIARRLLQGGVQR